MPEIFMNARTIPRRSPKKQDRREIMMVIFTPDINMSLYFTAVSITISIGYHLLKYPHEAAASGMSVFFLLLDG